MPKVSIITPFYNAVNTMAETADSVFSQTFTDWEWILYNDYSTDGSLEIATQLALKDSRIKVFSNSTKQRGPSHARNQAVANSGGELLAFLDADDVWLPDYLQRRLQDLDENHEAAFVYGPSVYFYKDRAHLQNTGISKTYYFPPAALIENFISHPAGTPCPSTALVRRAAFNKVNGFKIALMRGEDIAFFIELNTIYGAYYRETPLVRYRRHADSATSRANHSGDRLLKELPYYNWLYSFATEKNQRTWLRSAEYRYYAHVVEIVKEKSFLKARILLFQHLLRSPLSFRVYFYCVPDCLLPFFLAKRFRYYVYRILS